MTTETTNPPALLPDPSGGVPARRPSPDELPRIGRARRAWRWWLAKATRIGAAQGKALAWLAFWLGIGPVALVVGFGRRDRLDREPRPIGSSGWHTRTTPIDTDPRRARRPF